MRQERRYVSEWVAWIWICTFCCTTCTAVPLQYMARYYLLLYFCAAVSCTVWHVLTAVLMYMVDGLGAWAGARASLGRICM